MLWFTVDCVLALSQVFTPVEGGCCSCTTPEPAVFTALTAYHCEKGAEWVGGGAIQWVDFLLVNNEKAGIEAKLIMGNYEPYSETHGAMIKGGHIVAYDTTGARHQRNPFFCRTVIS